MKRIALVSCVKTKSTTAELAEHLYISPWFRMAREYARRNTDQWFILSAEHGLLDPRKLVEPYETTLTKFSVDQRRAWAQRVADQMRDGDVSGGRLLILAGQIYRKGLMQFLWTRFDEIAIPMDGLKIGEQLSWLSKRTT